MPTIDSVVGGYIRLRDEKKRIAERQKEELAPLNAKLKKMEAWLQAQLQAQDALNMKTEHGTVYLSTTVSAKVEDRDAFFDFVRNNDMWAMLTSNVSKDAVEEFIESTGDVPPGVSVSRETNARVRK